MTLSHWQPHHTPLAAIAIYYDRHAADGTQLLMEATEWMALQMSRECAAGQWSCPLPVPWFFVPSVCRIPFAVSHLADHLRHSNRQTRPDQPPSSSANRGQCQRNSSPRMLPSFLSGMCLECAALNKDHVCRIGPSHRLFACFHLFVSIQVPCPAPAVRGARQGMRENMPSGVVGVVGVVMGGKYQRVKRATTTAHAANRPPAKYRGETEKKVANMKQKTSIPR